MSNGSARCAVGSMDGRGGLVRRRGRRCRSCGGFRRGDLRKGRHLGSVAYWGGAEKGL